jgi:hypothetical protein
MGQQAQPITQPATNPFQGAAQAMQVAGGTLGNIAQGGMYPATQDFIKQTQGNMLQQQQMQQNMLDAQASQAGAFGGSRHGVAQGMMVDDYSRRMADMAAQQNLQAQQQAMRAATGLAGVGGQAFGMGQNVAAMTSAQGAFQRQLEQQLADAARGQTTAEAAFPLQGLGAMTSVLGSVPYSTTATQSSPFNAMGLLAALI